MHTRTFAVATVLVGAAALATGITYATSIVDSNERAAAPSGHHAAPSARTSPPSAQRSASAAHANGSSRGKKDEGRSQEGQDKQGQGDRDHSDGDDRGHGYRYDRGYGYGYKHKGRIYFNGGTYSARADGCVSVARGLGSSSFNVYNDSRMIIEVFRGFTCDNAAPVATVGPHDRSNGVVARKVRGSVHGDNDVVGSFRVIGRHHGYW